MNKHEEAIAREKRFKCGQRILYYSTNETGIFAGYTWDKYADRYKYCSIHLDNGNTIHGISPVEIKKN